jgi:hypothetical protein
MWNSWWLCINSTNATRGLVLEIQVTLLSDATTYWRLKTFSRLRQTEHQKLKEGKNYKDKLLYWWTFDKVAPLSLLSI